MRKVLLTAGLAALGGAGGMLLAWVLTLVALWILPVPDFLKEYWWAVGGGAGMLFGGWWARNAVQPGRLILITLALMAAGAVAGSLAAMVMMATWRPYADDMLSAALFGGLVGMGLGPLVAWGLMRHVPLWKALAGTWLGTVGGWMLGMLAGNWQNAVTLSLAGFLASAVVLRFATRRPRRSYG